jgi:hypothetical protein
MAFFNAGMGGIQETFIESNAMGGNVTIVEEQRRGLFGGQTTEIIETTGPAMGMGMGMNMGMGMGQNVEIIETQRSGFLGMGRENVEIIETQNFGGMPMANPMMMQNGYGNMMAMQQGAPMYGNPAMMQQQMYRQPQNNTVIVEERRHGLFGRREETVVVEQNNGPYGGTETVIVEEGRRHHHWL